MSEVPRLYLITPRVSDVARFRPLLETALASVEVACVLLRIAVRDDGEAKTMIRALAPVAQAAGAALLVENDPRLAARADADGVHLAGAGAALEEALAAMHPKKIVGVGALASRDEAMVAGEAGADYLMFGGPDMQQSHDETLERVAWWAEIFNVPCVGYASHPDRAMAIAEAGAEFVALCEGVWEPDVAAKLREVATALAAAGEVAR